MPPPGGRERNIMKIPEGLLFTTEHEWVLLDEDNIATVGISDFAAEQLGDITFVQLPQEGDNVRKDETFGVVESVKAVSDLYAPVTGRVVEINHPVLQSPELVNQDPYHDGWMVKIEVKDEHRSEIEGLMTDKEYSSYIEENN